LLTSDGERAQFIAAARALADEKRHVLDQVLGALAPWLGQKTDSRKQMSEDYIEWDSARSVPLKEKAS
jgi:hypothetical protein